MDPQQPTFIDVMYVPGLSVYGMVRARLEWRADDTLVLTTAEGTQEAPVYKEIFNVPVSSIEKVKSMLDELTFVTATGKHRVSVAQYSTPAIAAAGVAGTAAAYGMYKKSGADKWLQRFKDKGVKVSRLGYGALIGIAVGSALALIAIGLGIFFLLNS